MIKNLVSDDISQIIIEKFDKKKINNSLKRKAKIDKRIDKTPLDKMVFNETSKFMLQYFATYCHLIPMEFISLKKQLEFSRLPRKTIGISRFGAGILELCQYSSNFYLRAGAPYYFECEIQNLFFLEKIMAAFKYEKIN